MVAAMRTTTRVLISLATVAGLAGTALAEFSVRNDDDSSYELTKKCGDKSEDWSIAGKVTKKLSIPAGATSCTFTVKKTSTTLHGQGQRDLRDRSAPARSRSSEVA